MPKLVVPAIVVAVACAVVLYLMEPSVLIGTLAVMSIVLAVVFFVLALVLTARWAQGRSDR